MQYRSGERNTFTDTLTRLPLQEEINSLEIVQPYIDFDENFSDIQTLEELPIDEILPTISSAQQTDAFCEPIIKTLKPTIFQKIQQTLLA